MEEYVRLVDDEGAVVVLDIQFTGHSLVTIYALWAVFYDSRSIQRHTAELNDKYQRNPRDPETTFSMDVLQRRSMVN